MAKRFDRPDTYRAEIAQLIPGYELIHQSIPYVLQAAAPNRDHIAVNGCGPGDELGRLAEVFPGARIEAFEPSAPMADCAREYVEALGLQAHVTIHSLALRDSDPTPRFDLVTSILVGHLIPDDGNRVEYLDACTTRMREGAIALFVEMESMSLWQVESHVQLALERGLPLDRAPRLKQRLADEFHGLSPARSREIYDELGLESIGEFFRSFGFVGSLLRRTSRRSTADT
ncbi:MAG: class I SAM-dependent methyltransferase [Myxococcota bacterium]